MLFFHVEFFVVGIATAAAITHLGVLPLTLESMDAKPPKHSSQKTPVLDNDVTQPRMLLMRGCDGSTQIMQIAHTLLRFHEVDPKRQWDNEVLTPSKNIFYKNASLDMGKAMKMAHDDATKTNQSLVFKGMTHHADKVWPDVWRELKGLGLLTVLGHRSNMLDQVVCMVRDCFEKSYGHQVDENGKETDECFARREEGKTYMANINTRLIIESLDKEAMYVQDSRDMLEKTGFSYWETTPEDLLEYESGSSPKALQKAVEPWMKFLEAWGIQPYEHIVETQLKPFLNTRPPAAKHSDTIYNFDEVRELLQAAGPEYAKFLRE